MSKQELYILHEKNHLSLKVFVQSWPTKSESYVGEGTQVWGLDRTNERQRVNAIDTTQLDITPKPV